MRFTLANRDRMPPLGRGPRLKPRDYLDAAGNQYPPADDDHLVPDHNIAEFGDTASYRYLDYEHDAAGRPVELTWHQLGSSCAPWVRACNRSPSPVTGSRSRRPPGRRLRGRLLRRHPGPATSPSLFAPGTARPRRAARRRAVGCAPDGRADHHLGRRGRAGLPAKAPAKPAAAGARRGPGCGRRHLRARGLKSDGIAHLRVHVGLRPGPCRRGDHPPAVCTNVVQMVISVGLNWTSTSPASAGCRCSTTWAC